MNLPEQFNNTVKEHHLFLTTSRLLLAVSGGVDSVVLCDLCKKAGYDFSIAHCNFRLRGADSDRDEQFVKELAAKYHVPFYVKTFDTKTIAAEQKKSVEEAARDLRYEWFYTLLDPELSPIPEDQLPAYILTAHHADDNIETIVMKFFRGTGIKGLRGILPVNNKVVRPLLFSRRKEIEDYAWANQLEYVQDASNLDTAFTRNFFRNRMLLEINNYFPDTSQNILQNATRFREAEELYNQAIDQHKKQLLEQKGKEVHIPVLRLKKSSPLKTIVYEIIHPFHFTAHQTEEVIALLESESGKYVASSTHRIIRNRNWLIIAPLAGEEAMNVLIEEGEERVIFQGGELSIDYCLLPVAHSPFTIDNSLIAQIDSKLVKFPLLLRKWKAGDYFYPLGMKKKKKLSRFFIDQKLSKTQKENCWVLESNHRICWVAGHRIDDRFKLTTATKEVLRIELRPSENAGVL